MKGECKPGPFFRLTGGEPRSGLRLPARMQLRRGDDREPVRLHWLSGFEEVMSLGQRLDQPSAAPIAAMASTWGVGKATSSSMYAYIEPRHHSSSRGSPKASGLAAPHRELNHFVDISTRTAMVMMKGTVRHMYRDSTLGRTS